jgi:F-type H+-transporting ATPase subunit delta
VTAGILGRRYASALLALASEAGSVDKVSRDLHDFAISWQESRELRALFENPSVSVAARRQVLREIAQASNMDALVRDTMLLIADRGRMAYLVDVIEAFDALAEARSGRLHAEVITAGELPEAYFTELRKILEQVTGKQVVVATRVDPSLLGGVVTRIGDQVFDGSLSHRLNELKQELSR